VDYNSILLYNGMREWDLRCILEQRVGSFIFENEKFRVFHFFLGETINAAILK
jgi:hypothetical protein